MYLLKRVQLVKFSQSFCCPLGDICLLWVSEKSEYYREQRSEHPQANPELTSTNIFAFSSSL